MPPSGGRGRPGALFSLLFVVAVLASVPWLYQEPSPAQASGGGDAPCPTGATCADAGSAPLPLPSLPGDEVCPEAEYLCGGFDERGNRRVLRWNDDTRVIRVRVPRPPGEDAAVAIALQQAAGRGIRAWDRHPFPLHVDLTERPGPEDFAVTWVRRPSGAELGHALTEWTRVDGRADLRVSMFSLTFRSPFDAGRTLSPREVQLSAAHEMGHVLGLPHSGDPGDVMHPTNTALYLSGRDYRAMEALYGLPNGAEITR